MSPTFLVGDGDEAEQGFTIDTVNMREAKALQSANVTVHDAEIQRPASNGRYHRVSPAHEFIPNQVGDQERKVWAKGYPCLEIH